MKQYRYKTPHYQGAFSQLIAKTRCSNKWLIQTTPIQEHTMPRDTVLPHCYNGIPYQGTHSNNTDTRFEIPRDIVSPECFERLQYQATHFKHNAPRAHAIKVTQSNLTTTTGCSTNQLIPATQLQEPNLLRDSVSPHCYSTPLYEGANCQLPLKFGVHTIAKILILFLSVTRPVVCWMGKMFSEPHFVSCSL